MKPYRFLLFFSSIFVTLVSLSAQPAAENPAVVPTLRNDWLVRHEDFVKQAKAGGIELLFVGDSITDFWRNRGKSVWEERYAPLKAANFGIGGDRTEHVLWRLQNGELDGIKPKVTVLMIGTNNSSRDTAPRIADGITAIVKEIQKRIPSTKVLLLGVFPRAEKPDAPVRAKLSEVNRIIAKLDDGQQVFFLDIGKSFLTADGTIAPSIMPDFLHPTEAGYRIWADAMASKLAELR
jgi:lysophospholipase L1-like esterase